MPRQPTLAVRSHALISKTRAVVGGEVLRGRTELILALPEPAHVDVEVAMSMLHAAESAVAVGAWRRAWSPALSALFVAQRTFLSGSGGARGRRCGVAASLTPGTCTRVLRQGLSGNRGL
jgi:hypothetical protein